MNCTELQELAALKAVGVIDRESEARLEALIADNVDAASEVRSMIDAATALVRAASPPRIPPPQIRAKLLERIAANGRGRSASTTESALTAGFSVIRASNEGWLDAMPGIRYKVLAINQKEGYRVVMADLAPGARFPRHIHKTGCENLMVLSGDLMTEGRHLHAGDFLHAEGGTNHGELLSIEGCQALVIEPLEGPEIAMAETAAH